MPTLLLAVAFLSAFASEPGQPLDCSDWVFLEPGYSCVSWVPFGCPGVEGTSTFCHPASAGPDGITNSAFDNEGRQYRYERVFLGDSPCGFLNRIQILRYDGTTQDLFAHIDERCTVDGSFDRIENPEGFYVDFDDKQGRLFLWLKSRCEGPACSYTSGWWTAAIEGFATTFEILQTYEPTSNELSFRVPYMPEGFQAANWFDTYHGDLATLGDFSKARPLQCGYPASSPSVGDYFTVADPLPTPDPGQGRYYVTAVTYQRQTRYGRKSMGGVLSGREPAVLPACNASDDL